MIRRGLFILSVVAAPYVLIADSHNADDENSREAIAERLEPFGSICMEGEDCGEAPPPTTSGGGRTGTEIYAKHCFACHDTGVSEAPLVGSDAWTPRKEQGWDVLMKHTREGLNVVMPPMGTCMDCTDEELRAAIEYMINGE